MQVTRIRIKKTLGFKFFTQSLRGFQKFILNFEFFKGKINTKVLLDSFFQFRQGPSEQIVVLDPRYCCYLGMVWLRRSGRPENQIFFSRLGFCRDWNTCVHVCWPGVQDASSSEVRKAYKVRALQVHPDKNDAPDAEIQFRQTLQALPVFSYLTRKVWKRKCFSVLFPPFLV